MSWLTSLASGVIGKAAGSAIDVYNSKSIMERQYNYSKQLAEYVNSNKHQWEVSDLKNAGLNPILSANSTGYANSSLSGSTLVSSGLDSGSSAAAVADKNAKLQNDIAKEQVKIGYKNADSQSEQAAAATKNADTSAKVGSSQVGLNEANTAVSKANERYIGTQEANSIALNNQNIAESNARIENMVAQRSLLADYYNGMVSAAMQQAEAASRSAGAQESQAGAAWENAASNSARQRSDEFHSRWEEGSYDKLHAGDYARSSNEASYRSSSFGNASGYVGTFLQDAGRLFGAVGFR